jgi:hypothetical protein
MCVKTTNTWPQHVTPVDGEAKRLIAITSLRYKVNYSHRIRRKTATPRATFFLFHLPHFTFFHDCNLSPPLGNYKRGGRDLHGGSMESHLTKSTHTIHQRDLGSVPSLKSL